MMSCPSTCPMCDVPLRKTSLNSLRAHLARQHGLSAEEAYNRFKAHPGPCTQCMGPVKFISFQSGYERLCGPCNKKNSQLRGAISRRSKHTPAWNRGLTEATSDAVKRSTQGCRDYIKLHGHWRRGKTKENDASVATAATKISSAQKARWNDGTHGMIGKDSSNHEGVRHRGVSISNAYTTASERHWSKKPSADETRRRIGTTRKALIASGDIDMFRLDEEAIKKRLREIAGNWDVHGFEFSGHTSPVDVSCTRCHKRETYTLDVLYRGKICQSCFPANFSRWHRELYDWMALIDASATVNDRSAISPLELDILSGNKKLAIECNGLYWHSEATNTPRMYHQNKSNACLANGISLFHVFEDEWHDNVKRSIIKSIIRVKLGLASRDHARKLTLFSGSMTGDLTQFFHDNHIDGPARASMAFWLQRSDGTIACALALRRPHQQARWGGKTIEIARIATCRDVVVIGGMSRLISVAARWATEAGFNRMVTYRDTRLGGSGAGYVASGFSLSHFTEPRFWWTDGSDRIDRFAIRSIPGLATQKEVAFEHRMFKIHGCSNAVYVMDLFGI